MAISQGTGGSYMWRISYKTMSLQEVLIMAYMNLLQALTTERRSLLQ